MGVACGAGTVTAAGLIACSCAACQGAPVSCSEFEEHAGSRERRPGESIYLLAAEMSLRVQPNPSLLRC